MLNLVSHMEEGTWAEVALDNRVLRQYLDLRGMR